MEVLEHPKKQTEERIIDLLSDPVTAEQGFSLLVKAYKEKLYYHVVRMVIDHDDAHDVLQDAFVKCWRHFGSYKGDSSLYTWIYKIATNECLTFLSKKKRIMFLPLKDVKAELRQKVSEGKAFNGNEIEKKLQMAILTLPDKQRAVFNMKYFDEMTYEDMSKVLGTSVGALKASYHHAAKKIEEFFNRD